MSEWIDVNHRLPKHGQRIISLGIERGKDCYTSLEHIYNEKVGLVPEIKLWTTIPEPPKDKP